MLSSFTTLVAHPLDTLEHHLHPFLAKMKICQSLMVHLPTNHDVGRVMASLHLQNAPQRTFEHKSRCSGCYTAPRWWKNSPPWRGYFSACSQRATGRDALLRRISFKAGVRRCAFDRRCALMCSLSLMRHYLIGPICSALGTWSCFQSGYRRIRSRTVLIAASALTLFRRPDRALSSTPQSSLYRLIARQTKFREMFNGFKSLKIWESDFPHLWRAITATRFSLKHHSMLTLRETWVNCHGTSTWRVNSPKITNLWTLPPHCLQQRTTWNLRQNLRQDYVLWKM